MGLNYTAVGGTEVGATDWAARPEGLRSFQRSVRVGHGEEDWIRVSEAVMTWGVKTRSGFTVRGERGPGERVRVGDDRTLVAHVGPLRIHEPVRVVTVVDTDDRQGFAYGTRDGHPVAGEEAFIASRRPDGSVWLTLRSLTGPAPGPWRLAFPVVLIAQRWYRRRYQRALRP